MDTRPDLWQLLTASGTVRKAISSSLSVQFPLPTMGLVLFLLRGLWVSVGVPWFCKSLLQHLQTLSLLASTLPKVLLLSKSVMTVCLTLHDVEADLHPAGSHTWSCNPDGLHGGLSGRTFLVACTYKDACLALIKLATLLADSGMDFLNCGTASCLK